ncbi:MAG: SRPBCC family protein [Erythrobacter sp.]|uniref:SRPBCC family protein n=1 Tax=Erythrobacter sp. TaxID=1042 RepID=UPI003C71BA8E
MADDRDLKLFGTVAGAGILVGATVLGAALNKRRERDGSSDYAPRRTWRKTPGPHALVGRTVTIRKPRDELYEYWRDFNNLAAFMENLERVESEPGAGDRSTWVIRAPAGQSVDVETRVTTDRKGECIAWESVEGSDIETSGEVRFEDAPGDRGTRVTLTIEYDAPGGAIGRGIASMFLREPQIQARHDLKRFKMLMETGEIATSARTKDQTRAAQQENA